MPSSRRRTDTPRQDDARQATAMRIRYGASSALRLDQSFPNPFIAGDPAATSARIRYELPDADEVTLKIFSLSGVVVRTLADHELQSGGEQNAFFDGNDDNGTALASGIYHYVLETKSGIKLWNKMILVSK